MPVGDSECAINNPKGTSWRGAPNGTSGLALRSVGNRDRDHGRRFGTLGEGRAATFIVVDATSAPMGGTREAE